MRNIDQGSVRNQLLRACAADDFARLLPHLTAQTVEMHQTLIAPHAPVRTMFFHETGFTSVTTGKMPKIEVGIVGPEGLIGAAPVLLRGKQTPYEYFVQHAGDGFAISADALLAACNASEGLKSLLLRYVQAFLVQITQTAFTNAAFQIEARLARWLLMCQDRLGTQEFTITHEFISMMLGVQRTSVTGALQILEGNRLIKARRGQIEIRDREKLIQTAGEAYGVPEAEYARLISEG